MIIVSVDMLIDWNDWVSIITSILESEGVYAENLPRPWTRLSYKLIHENFDHLRSLYKKEIAPQIAANWVLECYMKQKVSSNTV